MASLINKRIKDMSREEKEELKRKMIEFETGIVKSWENAEIAAPIHFSGGNEEQLIEIFSEIKEDDWVFSTHRNHYHYLLRGGDTEKLKEMIFRGDSMHVFDNKLKFFTSAIVGGVCAIATGVALALKKKNNKNKVWCLVGDGAEDAGHFYEAVRYVDGFDLPCTFIIEDNDRSVETPKKIRYGKSEITWPKCIRRYHYTATYPHVGTTKYIDFAGQKVGQTL